ncbi:MAG: ParA family protein [Gammaproteobacteria bacterium]
MRSILVLNPKGGCGKSTLAMNIAAFFALQGHKTALADCDPQGSCNDWLAVRPEDRPTIYKASISGKNTDKPRATDVLVIDSPAATHGAKLVNLLKHAETVVVPVLPSAIDMRAVEHFLQELVEVKRVLQKKVKLATVANRVREDTLAAAKLENYLDHIKLPNGVKLQYMAILRNSQNYVHAAEQGLSIFELPPSRTYYDQEQWDPLLRWLNSARSQP